MHTETSLVKCPKPECGIHFSPQTSSPDCPHRWIGRATPLLDELAAKLKRGESVKLEPWNPAHHAHTGTVEQPA
jgi:hypothetical protein